MDCSSEKHEGVGKDVVLEGKAVVEHKMPEALFPFEEHVVIRPFVAIVSISCALEEVVAQLESDPETSLFEAVHLGDEVESEVVEVKYQAEAWACSVKSEVEGRHGNGGGSKYIELSFVLSSFLSFFALIPPWGTEGEVFSLFRFSFITCFRA